MLWFLLAQSPSEPASQAKAASWLDNQVQQLSSAVYLIMDLAINAGDTLREIASEFDISVAHLQQISKRNSNSSLP